VTATTPAVSQIWLGPFAIVAADFNEDGVPDLAMLTKNVTMASILLTEPTETSTATVNHIAPIGAGMHNVKASYSGDRTYRSGVSDIIELTAGLAPIVYTPAAGTYSTPQTITLSESIPGSTIYYSASGIVNTNGFVPYTSPIPLTESGVTTITAYATEAGYQQSYYAPETYTINLPALVLNSLSPAIKPAGSSAFALTVKGLGFTASSTVTWGSTALSTQYVSATELTAQVPASAIATTGTAALMVQTPSIGASNTLMFEIDSGGANTPPNFAAGSATVSRGSSATYPVTLPSSATNISVTCLNLPSGATCSYSGSTGAITIYTSSGTPAGTYQIIVVFTETLPGLATAMVLLPIFLLPRLSLTRREAPRRFWLTIRLALLFSAVAIAVGCGGGGTASPPPPQTHQVTSSGVVTLMVQ
jgi:hypothetical protein